MNKSRSSCVDGAGREAIPGCLSTSSCLQLLPVNQQHRAPEESPQGLCRTPLHVFTAYHNVRELSGNPLDHLKSCVLFCTTVYLTHFLYVRFAFTKAFTKNKWRYDAVQNAVCKKEHIITHTTLRAEHINTRITPCIIYVCTLLFSQIPIMGRTDLSLSWNLRYKYLSLRYPCFYSVSCSDHFTQHFYS